MVAFFSMNELKDHVMYTRRENLNLKGVSRDYGAPFEGGGGKPQKVEGIFYICQQDESMVGNNNNGKIAVCVWMVHKTKVAEDHFLLSIPW